VISLLIGWAVALLGFFVIPLHFLWAGGWLFSLLGGLIAYSVLMRKDRSVIPEHRYQAITRTEPSAAHPAAAWTAPQTEVP
jgi:NCS1 family nucleobase:cation symporter-1